MNITQSQGNQKFSNWIETEQLLTIFFHAMKHDWNSKFSSVIHSTEHIPRFSHKLWLIYYPIIIPLAFRSSTPSLIHTLWLSVIIIVHNSVLESHLILSGLRLTAPIQLDVFCVESGRWWNLLLLVKHYWVLTTQGTWWGIQKTCQIRVN